MRRLRLLFPEYAAEAVQFVTLLGGRLISSADASAVYSSMHQGEAEPSGSVIAPLAFVSVSPSSEGVDRQALVQAV